MKAATKPDNAVNIEFKISIHAAREGGDNFGYAADVKAAKFQSTPPVKAATRARMARCGDF